MLDRFKWIVLAIAREGARRSGSRRRLVAGARKEALWLTFRDNSKADRLGKTKFGSRWMYAPPSGPPSSVIDFLKSKHPESAGL